LTQLFHPYSTGVSGLAREMIKLIAYKSGAVTIVADHGQETQLDQPAANRLILAARMHSVEPFMAKLEGLIPNAELARSIRDKIAAAKGSERWNLKENFARLPTVEPDIKTDNPEEIAEEVTL